MTFDVMRTVFTVLGLIELCGAGGCTNATKVLQPSSEDLLRGTAWQLARLGPSDVLESAQPTLGFTQTDDVAGSGSCNRFTGSVTLSGESISFGPLAATRMACGEAVDVQEAHYFEALQNAQRFVVSGNRLTIHTKVVDLPLLFIRTSPK